MNKNTFFTGQPIFSQLLKLIPSGIIQQLCVKHKSDRYYKRFKTYDHLVSMLYAGFFQCVSLRELITGIQANSGRLNHLGLRYTPRRSTLAEANKNRTSDFFADLYHELYDIYFGLPDSRFNKKSKEGKLFIIDSTTISLFSSIMLGSGSPGLNGKKKGGAKAHMMIDAQHDIPAFISITEARDPDVKFFRKLHVPENSTIVFDKGYNNLTQFDTWNKGSVTWVTRLKKNTTIEYLEENPITKEQSDKGVVKDSVVLLGWSGNSNKYPQAKSRIIEYYDKEKDRIFHFITNDFCCEPCQTADIYKQRWQIEILFKRIKQRYPLKYFLGDNPNAIKIQIWCALICDILVKIIQTQINKKGRRKWSYATLSGMIKHHLMTYIKIKTFLLNPEEALLNYHPPDTQLNLFSGKKGLPNQNQLF